MVTHTHAHPPFPSPSTRHTQADDLAQSSVYEPERLRAMAEAERERLERAGFVDSIEEAMPPEPPPWSELVGRCDRIVQHALYPRSLFTTHPLTGRSRFDGATGQRMTRRRRTRATCGASVTY